MSLLLDALKKSDQERRKRVVPDLETVHVPAQPQRRRLHPGWILGVFLLLNGAGWYGWGQFGSSPAPMAASEIEPRQEAGPPAPTPTTRPAPARVAPPPRSTAEGDRPVSPTRPVEPSQALLSLEDLPSHIRQEVADYELSMHYFATAPASRLVRLNGRLLREGQSLSEGGRVMEIRPGGVVLEKNGYRFLLPRTLADRP